MNTPRFLDTRLAACHTLGMEFKGIKSVASDDLDGIDMAKGVRTCLTVGLAFACDAVFENGRAAMARIEELSESIGLDETLVVLKDSLVSIGRLKQQASCPLDYMDTEKLRMMVFQFQMFRMVQHAMIQAEEEA